MSQCFSFERLVAASPRRPALPLLATLSTVDRMATTPSTANLLRDLRREQGRSLRSAAADIGVAPSQLSRLERGQRGIGPAVSERLSTYYGVTADLISLAQGEVPADILEILLAHPEAIDDLRRRYKNEAPDQP
jgi:transcriptional regulator with XRE-family HTH domain